MTDVPRSQAYLTGTAFADGQTAGSITPQRVRDLVVTVVPSGAIMTTGSSITMTTTTLLINKASGSPTAVTLPASPVAFSMPYLIKDQKGDAATNPITVTPSSGLIDQAASFVINVNFMSAAFLFDGTNWSVV